MKYIILNLLLLICLPSLGQITLEKSYSSYGTVTVHNIENEGYKYMAINTTNKAIYLFNDNHSVWKTIYPNIPNKSWLTGANYASSMLFDSDNGVEIEIQYYDTSNGAANYKSYIAIVDENGQILANIPDCNYGYVVKVGNSFKLIVNKVAQPPYSDVYSLPGKLLAVQKTGKGSENIESTMYPNPMDEYAFINYQLPAGANSGKLALYNQAGVQVKNIDISNNSGMLNVERNGLPAGVYQYTISTGNTQQISRQFVIN